VLVEESAPVVGRLGACADLDVEPVARRLQRVDDGQARGWDHEAARHHRVEANLQQHLDRLRGSRENDPPS
jgi:hypothetical protein